MQIASSAKRTCSELRSASLYTATVRMPSSRHALITRNAISPRLATSTFLSIESLRSGGGGASGVGGARPGGSTQRLEQAVQNTRNFPTLLHQLELFLFVQI